MHGRVVGQAADRADPHGLMGDAVGRGAEVDGLLHVAHVEGAVVGPVRGDGVVDAGQHVARARQGLRLGDPLGHGRLVLGPSSASWNEAIIERIGRPSW